MSKIYSTRLAKQLDKLMRQLEIAYISYLKQNYTIETADISTPTDRPVFEFEKFVDNILAIASRYINTAVRSAYFRAIDHLKTNRIKFIRNLPIGLSPADKHNIKIVSGNWLDMYKSLTEEMKGDIRAIMADASRKGLKESTVIRKVRDVFKKSKRKVDMGGPRRKGVRARTSAKLIGEQAYVDAYNMALYTKWRNSGEVSGVVWQARFGKIAGRKEGPCPYCNQLNGKKAKFEEKFKATWKGRQMEALYPPLHPHCVCEIFPIRYIE